MEVTKKTKSLWEIPDNIGENWLKKELSLKKRQKAMALVSGAYVNDIKLFASAEKTDSILIRGKVNPSQRKSDPCHVVDIEIDTIKMDVTDAHCKCKQGDGGSCSHVVAVLMALEQLKLKGYKEVPDMLACTSLPQLWDKPRGEKITPEPVSQMIICRPTNVNRKRRPVMAEFIDNRKITLEPEDIQALKKLKCSPISYLVQDATQHINTPFGQAPVGSALSYHGPLIEPIDKPIEECARCGDVQFPKLCTDTDLTTLLKGKENNWQDVQVSKEEAATIESSTRGQVSSGKWYEERKRRITASNFGIIMTRQKAVNDSFLRNTFCTKTINSKSTSYGQANEKNAERLYIKKTKRHLHVVGLVINPMFPFLGATPDAIVCDDGETGIMEVKCPYSARDMTIPEAVRDIKDFFLTADGRQCKLKQSHKHYYQVQGQLLVTGAPFCDFVVFTKHDMYIERVFRDKPVMQLMLEKLLDFYIQHFNHFVKC